MNKGGSFLVITQACLTGLRYSGLAAANAGKTGQAQTQEGQGGGFGHLQTELTVVGNDQVLCPIIADVGDVRIKVGVVQVGQVGIGGTTVATPVSQRGGVGGGETKEQARSDFSGQILSGSCVAEEVAGLQVGGLQNQADLAVRNQGGAGQGAFTSGQYESTDQVGGIHCTSVDVQGAGAEGDARAHDTRTRAGEGGVQRNDGGAAVHQVGNKRTRFVEVEGVGAGEVVVDVGATVQVDILLNLNSSVGTCAIRVKIPVGEIGVGLAGRTQCNGGSDREESLVELAHSVFSCDERV